ncbi:MAG TPA: AI-2E family transporter [Polyangiaceae bacterium]
MTSSSSSTPPPPRPEPRDASHRSQERRAFGVLALAAVAFLVRLAMPVGVGLFLGALLAFTLEPLYARLRRRKFRAGPSALLCALGATVAIAATVAGISTLLVTRGLALIDSIRSMTAPGGALRGLVDGVSRRLTTLHVDVPSLAQRLENEVLSLGSRVAGIAADVAGFTFDGLLTLFFMTMAAYFVLRHWTSIVARAEAMLPFERRHTHALLDQFRTTGRQVLLGTVVTGLVQGLFAAFGYWITGTPEPAFFGALTAVASLIPGVGTLLVWGTIGAAMMATGHLGAGLAELIYGAVVVGIVSDYVVRPALVGHEKGVPAIVVFVALFGGVEVFGVIGLVLGPVIATMSMAVLRAYADEVGGGHPG